MLHRGHRCPVRSTSTIDKSHGTSTEEYYSGFSDRVIHGIGKSLKQNDTQRRTAGVDDLDTTA